jgi:FG-GAP-like repeat
MMESSICLWCSSSITAASRAGGGANAYGGKIEGAPDTEIYYCIPRVFEPMPSHLYRNEGAGRFTDVSKDVGISRSPGKGFGVVATDINNDGYLDLFQANDTVPTFLFVNRGGKKFIWARLGNLWVTGGSADGLSEEAVELAAGGVKGALLVFPAVVD